VFESLTSPGAIDAPAALAAAGAALGQTLGVLLAVLALLLLAGAWFWAPALRTLVRRAALRRQPFPPAWREILRRRMPLFARLPAAHQLRLKRLIPVFLAEVPLIGCNGQPITDEVRVLIAAQAGLLRLGRRPAFAPLFPGLRQVLVYPGAFVVRRERPGPGGLVHAERQVLSGEAWQQGQVVLAWADVLAGAAGADDGHNVVIHEFAHRLDQEGGAADGAPPLPAGRHLRARQRRWAQVMAEEFQALRTRLARGEPALIDAYGATEPAEFFAVLSELFFERPQALAAAHPALYNELAGLYRVDPAGW
jgi:MtfA peptidase